MKVKKILAMALLTAGALAASCSSEDNIADEPQTQQPEENVITLTATLAAKGDNGSGTRVITTGKDAQDKEILNVAWAKGEQVAIYYQKIGDSWATATATVGKPNDDGSASITATLYNAKGGTASFVYPASLANTTGDIDEVKLISQNGNLTGDNGISTKFDAATGTGTITVKGSEASVSGMVMMTNRVCICKFHFDIVDGNTVGPEREFSPVIIRDGNGHTYTITSDRQGNISTRGFNRNDDIYIAMLPVSGKTVSFYTKYTNQYLFTASNTTLTAGKFYRNLYIEMVKDESGQCNKYRDLRDGSITANDGDIIYQRVNTSAIDKTITIPDGATVTLAGVNISATGSAGITCSGNATINIEGANTVTTTAEAHPAIFIPEGKTLTIQSSGSLTATGGKFAAGIGSGAYGTCGDITINGGTITATGGSNAAGIGGGEKGNCGDITISGGTVKANSESFGAGIGSGVGSESGYYATCGDITISGGNVTATCGTGGAGIGSGHYATCGDITISGGTVTAKGGRESAGIGSGESGNFASIFITKDITIVTAIAGYSPESHAKQIGKGKNDTGSGTVTVDGVSDWAGAETTHLNFTNSTTYEENDTWTLTKK